MHIWIDADACPVRIKELIFKASFRTQIPVTLVANSRMSIPKSDLIEMVVVSSKFDAADHYILEHAQSTDLVISSDIILASSLVDKNVSVISNSGRLYTKQNVKDALSMRNLMEELRGGQMISGGPPPFSNADMKNFADAFDKELTRLSRAKKH